MNETELINYVQEAFHMESEKHQQLLEIATMKEVLLNCKTPSSLIFNHVYNIYQIHGITLAHLNLRALATRAGSPGDINVPRAGSPGDIKVPRAGSPSR